VEDFVAALAAPLADGERGKGVLEYGEYGGLAS